MPENKTVLRFTDVLIKSLWGKTIHENMSTVSSGETPLKQGREENRAFIVGTAILARREKAGAERRGGVEEVQEKVENEGEVKEVACVNQSGKGA